MPPKPIMNEKSSTLFESEETNVLSSVSISLYLRSELPEPGDWLLLVLFNGQIVLDGKWIKGTILETEALPMNLNDAYFQDLIADNPLIFIVRVPGGKAAKDPDPLLNIDNRFGGTLDLLPLLLGEENIFVTVPLIFISTGLPTEYNVVARVVVKGTYEIKRVPLTMTIISTHCLPYAKEGTVYLAAIGFDGVLDPMSVNFGMSVSFPDTEKIVWASASNMGRAANTAFNIPKQDIYIPYDTIPKNKETCRSIYWNAMKRVLIDPQLLEQRLSSPFLLEVAGIPRTGKIDVRGRYMGFIDAGVLLESGQYGVSICTKLLFYSEAELPDQVGALLELPPTSAKPSHRETNLVMDENGHTTFVIVRFDLLEPLVSKVKMISWFNTIGISPPEGTTSPIDELEIEPAPKDATVDVRRIIKEGGALAVHKELSCLASRGVVPMNQGIKRTAASQLLVRVRTMLKQFSPGNCSIIDWQDIVTAQHGASRRAVTSSFAPQAPPLRQSSRFAAARCRIAGDTRIAEKHIQNNLNIAKNHPRALFSKALRCLEERNDIDARNYLLEALSVQIRNKYLLWTYGGQDFDKGFEGAEAAAAAFAIAIKGDYSDGTAKAIGWAALHALYHYLGNSYAAFVAGVKMRKAYELPREWKTFFQRWTNISGEEECLWIPSAVASDNPLLITATFFLCLRCFKFSEKILYCYVNECASRGSRNCLKAKLSPDFYYLQASSLLLRHQYNEALEITQKGIRIFGPSPMMCQMRTSCLMCIRGWDGECEDALKETERFGAEECPAIMLRAAISGLVTNPHVSLQRAARAHKIAPSAHSALTIGRIYHKLCEESLAERWAAAAIKLEPYLADAWAFLSLLAMYERNFDKARSMLRTAKQAGPISQDIEAEVTKMSEIVQLETLPGSLVENLCLCDYL